MPRAELADLVQQLTDQMLAAARDLQFELAARLRESERKTRATAFGARALTASPFREARRSRASAAALS